MQYRTEIETKIDSFKNDSDTTKKLVLGIETSCDDTSAAIVENGEKVLSMATNSQILLHREFGGVVPEIASRNHVKNLGAVVDKALSDANIALSDISAVAITSQPGLLGSLLSGVSFAKGIAYAGKIPLVGVNHIGAHISANYLSNPELTPPFVCLVASGGHSQVIYVKSHTSYEILGGTCDDAAGEALDKIARALGLPYPGGVYLEEMALSGNENAYRFRSQFNISKQHNFSFSGIKTAVINVLHNAEETGTAVSFPDVAASFQRAIVDTLVFKTILCAQSVNAKTITIAGGVSANKRLRASFEKTCADVKLDFFCPEIQYCGDNGAMVACAGYYMLKNGIYSDLSLDAKASGDLQKLFVG